MAYEGKFIDRSPYLRAAGALHSKTGDNVGGCFVHKVTEEEGRPFTCRTGPLDYKLPPKRTNIYKGFYSDVWECIQPDIKQTSFYDVLKREFKDTVYDSYWKMPVGRLPDHVPMLPPGMDPLKVCFGKPTPKDVTVKELVSPTKCYVDVMEESRVAHEMYLKTHNDYTPGEQIRRNYVHPYHENLVWGIPNPCDPHGGCIKKVMTDNADEKILVSKILADHRTRTKPLVGKVHAPNHNIECVPKGHAFGKLNKRGLDGVAELMKESPPNLDRLYLLDEMSHINSIRQQISKKQPIFPHRDLVDAFHQINSNNTDCIPLDKAYETLAEFSIYPDKSIFESLLARLNILTKDGRVNYKKMALVLNVNEEFPDIGKLADVPSEFLNFETTNQLAHKYHCLDNVETKSIGAAGVHSTDHVPIESLVSPSIFTNYGLQPKDFLVSRSPQYLHNLFLRMGCEMDDQTFYKVWNTARGADDCVSVVSFYDNYKLLCKQ